MAFGIGGEEQQDGRRSVDPVVSTLEEIRELLHRIEQDVERIKDDVEHIKSHTKK